MNSSLNRWNLIKTTSLAASASVFGFGILPATGAAGQVATPERRIKPGTRGLWRMMSFIMKLKSQMQARSKSLDKSLNKKSPLLNGDAATASKKSKFRLLRFIGCLAVMTAWVNTFPAGATTFYIATTGNDANAGSEGNPFATFERARDEVRQLKANGLAAPVDIVIRGGVYYRDRTLELTAEDGGTDRDTVTWRAAEGERVEISGGKPVTGWKPWRRGIFVADLKTQGLAGVSFHQLFYKTGGTRDEFAQRMVLARYPKFDAQHPRTGGFVLVSETSASPQEQLCYAAGALPFEKWKDLSQAEVVSTYSRGWMFAITPIRRVDTESRSITVEPVRGKFLKQNRFFIQNVLDALTAPGEWYLDRKESLLYFYPPSGDLAHGQVLVPVLDHLVDVHGTIPYCFNYLNTKYQGTKEQSSPPQLGQAKPVLQLVFKKLDFECAEQDGLRISGARSCQIIGCRVANIGGIGLNLGAAADKFSETGNPRRVPATGSSVGGAFGGGQMLLLNDPCMDCRVTDCDVWTTGMEGILLLGEGNRAENNHVWDIGLYAKDAPCINLLGAGNNARRNTLHDCPRCAVFLKGVDNVVELNDCHHTCLETCDMGAIRMVQRNLNLKGNKIRYNRILDTVGYGYRQGMPYQSPYFTWGIYLDDYTAGTEVVGNIVSRTGLGGIMVHGGGDNLVANNIVVNAGSYQIQFEPMENKKAYAGNRAERNIFVCTTKDSYGYLMSSSTIRDASEMPVLQDNLFWAGTQELRFLTTQKSSHREPIAGLTAWMAWSGETGSSMADPKLASLAQDDYRLASDSPAWKMGFSPIPLEQIGCYSSPERTRWPSQTDRDRFRETQVIYGQ